MLCLLCYQPTANRYGFCYQCIKNLPYTISACEKCGLPLFNKTVPCHFCRQISPKWQHLIAVTDYIQPLKKLVHQLKFQKRTVLANALASLMMRAYLDARRTYLFSKPDIITCIPMRQYRYWSRGYNQSALLAKPIAKWLDRPFSPHLLQQISTKRPQLGLAKQARQLNVHNIYRCTQDLSGKSIAIIDDVITTGATMNEACKMLKQQGATNIQVICLCRTIL